MYKITLIAVIIISLCGYLFFSKPDNVVIDEKGRVEGLVNKSRAMLQGDSFWEYQLKLANEENSRIQVPHLPSSANMQAMYLKLREYESVLDDSMKVLYTAEEQMAKYLRIKADSIERVGKWRIIDEEAELLRSDDIGKLKIIIPLIEAKLHIKPEVPKP